jgi:hypothetical protein
VAHATREAGIGRCGAGHARGGGGPLRAGAKWSGFVYVPVATDVLAPRIVERRVSCTAHADCVLDALDQALHDRSPKARMIHHSDRGSRDLSIRDTERLAEAGSEPSAVSATAQPAPTKPGDDAVPKASSASSGRGHPPPRPIGNMPAAQPDGAYWPMLDDVPLAT